MSLICCFRPICDCIIDDSRINQLLPWKATFQLSLIPALVLIQLIDVLSSILISEPSKKFKHKRQQAPGTKREMPSFCSASFYLCWKILLFRGFLSETDIFRAPFFADANNSISANECSKTSDAIHHGCTHDLLTFLGLLTKLAFISPNNALNHVKLQQYW